MKIKDIKKTIRNEIIIPLGKIPRAIYLKYKDFSLYYDGSEFEVKKYDELLIHRNKLSWYFNKQEMENIEEFINLLPRIKMYLWRQLIDVLKEYRKAYYYYRQIYYKLGGKIRKHRRKFNEPILMSKKEIVEELKLLAKLIDKIARKSLKQLYQKLNLHNIMIYVIENNIKITFCKHRLIASTFGLLIVDISENEEILGFPDNLVKASLLFYKLVNNLNEVIK